MEDMIIKLQTTLADQAEDIASLSEELYAQQKEVIELKRQYAELKGRVQVLSDEDGAIADVGTEPPPPHY